MIENKKEAEKRAVKKQLTAGFSITLTLLVLLSAITPSFINIFKSPDEYFGSLSDYAIQDFQLSVAIISLYSAVVLLGYIFYLLLTSSTRAEIIAQYKVKDMSDSHSQLEELYENAPVPYFTINKDGLIIGCNKSAFRFFGVLPEEIAGKNFFAFAHEDDIQLGEKFLTYFKADSPIDKQEFRMITKNEGMKWVSLSIFLTTNFSNGEKNGLVTTFDLTEQKKLDQAKTEFVSLASHQLRTPLATFKWFTEMLASDGIGSLNDKQKEYIHRMGLVNSGMIDLVETLLNVSRIEIGSLKIEKKEIDIVPIIDSILIGLNSQIKKKNIQVRKNIKSESVKIESDPELFRIVIQNLITNAIKYNKDGGFVDINFSENLNQKLISVTDTGLGIPKEDQSRVFSKLFRAKNVESVSSGQSTGLGLYLSKSVLEAMGGTINFTSVEGEGSTFTLGL